MTQRLGFDTRLPDLPALFDLEAVAQRFVQHWPAFSAQPAPQQITRCKLQDTKYQPGQRCVNVYELHAKPQLGPAWRTIGVTDTTAAGTALRLYNNDPKLPWLASAANPETMARLFASLPAEVSGGAVMRCEVTPVRYKPGARCVFRYDLTTASGPRTFFGKLLGQGAEQLMATIMAIHAVSQRDAQMPRIPRPLAYWPEVQMLVQPNVGGGAELNERAFDMSEPQAVRERLLREAGTSLAAFHASVDVPGEQRTLAQDLVELQEYLAPMELADAQLAERYAAAIARIAALAAGRAELPATAAHGAFRTDQFLIEEGRLVLIDMDTYCWASPARDLGNFLAYLRWKAIRQQQIAAEITRAGELFLAGYGPLDPHWLALYSAASMLKIVGRRFRSLTVKEWHLVPQLLDMALEELP